MIREFFARLHAHLVLPAPIDAAQIERQALLKAAEWFASKWIGPAAIKQDIAMCLRRMAEGKRQ